MPSLEGVVSAALAGRYQIERELGHGGMATVYLARDAKHDRQVALKVLRPELTATLGSDRFLREIQVSARLTHPNILAVYDSGNSNGVLYYVMPYIEGESLRARLSRETRLGIAESIGLGRKMADALDYAHSRGVVHRDVKPENVLLAAGHAVIGDFGIARAMHVAGVTHVTAEGVIIGTPAYMSPEQAGGERDIDGRSDIYSLGCLLFETLVGSTPFTGNSAQTLLVRRLTEDAPLLRTIDSSIPVALEAVVAKALATDPADRFATAGELSGALDRVERLGPGAAVVPGPSTTHRLTDASIAVLPFANLSADPETEYFSDGMTDEMINALSQVRGLRVAARSSSFMFKGRNIDARDIGEQLRVRTLLQGSVRKSGNRIRLTAQLVSVGDGYHLWSQTYERTLSDVFALQDELARAITATLTQKVVGTSSGPLVQPPTDNVDAYTLYLRGRHAWTLASLEGFETAASCFEQALAADPNYAVAHAWLAYAYAIMGFDEFGLIPSLEAIPKIRSAATRALELDPGLGDAHFAQALLAALYDWDWTLARKGFERALEAGSASSLAQHWYAMFLCAMGQPEEGLQVARRAQILDPLSLAIQVTVGRCLHFGRRFEEAAECFRSHLQLNPASIQGYISLARTLLAQRKWDEVASELERAMQRLGRVPILLCFSAQAHAWAGRTDQARELLAELKELATRRHVPILYEAQICFSLGDMDAGFQRFEQAVDQHSGWVMFLRVEATWDQLRDEPRFKAVLRRAELDF